MCVRVERIEEMKLLSFLFNVVVIIPHLDLYVLVHAKVCFMNFLIDLFSG